MNNLSASREQRDATRASSWSLRVLLISQMVVYPADAGPKVKTLQTLRHLAARHEVTYCAFARTPVEHQQADALRPLCHRVETVQLSRSRLSDIGYLAASLATGESFLLRRDDRAEMRTAVRRLLAEERIEVIHVDQLNMMQFVPPEWTGPIVLDEHNAVWLRVERLRAHAPDPIRRWLLGREARLIRSAEAGACQRADVVLAVSEQDREALRAITSDVVNITVAPIAVDVAHYAPIREARAPQPDRLLTIGTMFSPPNSEGVAWWLREGFEQLRALRPQVIYDIVGPRPPASLRALASRRPGARLHGYVADPAPFWTGASVLAVPLLSGGGVRVKILEAMASGVPIVSTSVGCEGLGVRDGEHLLIADTPEAFAQACARLLADAPLARRLAANAYQLVRDRYDTGSALAPLDAAYDALRPNCACPMQTAEHGAGMSAQTARGGIAHSPGGDGVLP
jgi:glycosyltransferase involved in cell wall biosynthesis